MDGNATNSGTIGAREATVITAGNIVNQAGGTIQGGSVNLAAREDLSNLVSSIKGGKGLERRTRYRADVDLGVGELRQQLGSYLTGVARVDAGSLSCRPAAICVDRRAGGRRMTRCKPGGHRPGHAHESHGDRIARGSRNRHETRSSREIGADIAAGGNLTLVAGQDINARGERHGGQAPAVGAGRDVNLTAGVETAYAYDESYRSGAVVVQDHHIIQSTDQTRAGLDLHGRVDGRDGRTRRQRQRLERGRTEGPGPFRWPGGEHPPGENTSQDYDYKRVKKSGLGAMGGLSIGTRRQTDSVDGKQVFHTASTVGSVEGNVLIKAGNGLNVVGSNVIARQGDVTLIGQQVNIVAALDTARSKEFHEIKQSGLSVTASNPVVSAVQTGERMASAASKVDNPVMQGLAAGTAGLAAYNAYDAVQKMGSLDKATSLDKVGGVSVQISLGSRAPAPPNATHPARRAPPSRRART